MEPIFEHQELVSIKTLSGLLDLPEKTIRGWVWKRKIPYLKIGKLIRFNLREIRIWYGRGVVEPLNNTIVRDRIPGT